MIIDHIQEDTETLGMAGIHQPLQSFRSAVQVLGCKEIDAIVAPTARTLEFGCGHNL
ncbi:hypothetical protein D3C83_229990 [compost metagenome]